jgi:hypothetical protein
VNYNNNNPDILKNDSEKLEQISERVDKFQESTRQRENAKLELISEHLGNMQENMSDVMKMLRMTQT